MTASTEAIVQSAPRKGGGPAMIRAFVRAYPGRSAGAVVSVLLAGLMDGLGLSMLLSMLNLASKEGTGAKPTLPEQVAIRSAELLGLPPTALVLLSLAIVLIIAKAALSLVANRQVGYAVARIATDLRLAVVRAVMAARWKHVLQQSAGRVANAVATEASRAADAFQQAAEMVAMVVHSLIYLAIAFSISWQAGLAAMLVSAALLLLLQRLIRVARRAGQRQTDLLKSLMSSIARQLAAAKPLKAMAREQHVDALISDQNTKLMRAVRRQVISKEALAALQDPILAIMVGVGFYLCVHVLAMPLASVLVMLFLLARVVNYLSKAQRFYQQIAMRESAYWSIVDAIDHATREAEPRGGVRTVTLAEGIRFDGVRFGHDEARPVLDAASFEIPAQRLTVVVGPSGAGKTTLIDLVTGLLHAQGGRILVDGVPLEELDLMRWRRLIGYVPQESVLVNESIAHNLRLGEEVDDEALVEALRAADALGFVEAMPDGLQTLVGEGGSRLSGGQRQRLAIARALVHKPRLLILDEATSHLDAEAQAAVIETVRHLKGTLTILAVAHQERLVAAADRVLRLAEGRIEALPVGVEALAPAHG